MSQRGAILNFASLENFLQGNADSADVALPGLVDSVRGYRQSLRAMLAQDDVRVKQNLTVNLGLRYEFITVPTEANGKISNLRNVLDPKITAGDHHRLLQVFLNLAQNSHRAMQGLAEKQLTVSAAAEGYWVVVRFVDTGPGNSGAGPPVRTECPRCA